jgi:WD40 repeat protein
VWQRCVSGLGLGLVLAACGFRSAASGGGADGGSADAAVDGPGSGAGDGSGAAADCWAHWMDGSVAIAAAVQELTELSGTTDDVAPWISDDGLRLYFSRNPGAKGQSDVYRTSRGSPAQPFGAPAQVTNLNTSGQEGRVWLTSDELLLAISIQRGAVFDIELSRRTAGQDFGASDGNRTALIDSEGSQRFTPFLTPDGLRLYFSANTGPGQKLELWGAGRATVNDDFMAPSQVPGVNSSNTSTVDPTLYQGERLLLFSTFSAGSKADLWYATRSTATASFGAPIAIPVDVAGSNEFDPALTADGCELFFTSDRDADGKFHLFHVRIAK